MARSTRLYDRGAQAFRAALPHLPHVVPPRAVDRDVYVCPLCLWGFERDQINDLRREHVPPSALRGQVTTLTCADCNHDAGPVQAHAAARAEWKRFASNQDGATQTGRVTGEGYSVTAEMTWRDGAFFVLVDPERSNPAAHQRLLDVLPASGEGASPQFTFEGAVGFARERAQTSQLRDAYLAAFATLGYRYILWPGMDDVRRRINDATPDPRMHWRTDIFPGDFRGVVTWEQPLETVAVIVDGDATFLPWPTREAEFDEWLNEWRGGLDDLKGQVHEWPVDMPMHLDRVP